MLSTLERKTNRIIIRIDNGEFFYKLVRREKWTCAMIVQRRRRCHNYEMHLRMSFRRNCREISLHKQNKWEGSGLGYRWQGDNTGRSLSICKRAKVSCRLARSESTGRFPHDNFSRVSISDRLVSNGSATRLWTRSNMIKFDMIQNCRRNMSTLIVGVSFTILVWT